MGRHYGIHSAKAVHHHHSAKNFSLWRKTFQKPKLNTLPHIVEDHSTRELISHQKKVGQTVSCLVLAFSIQLGEFLVSLQSQDHKGGNITFLPKNLCAYSGAKDTPRLRETVKETALLHPPHPTPPTPPTLLTHRPVGTTPSPKLPSRTVPFQ